MKIIHSVSNVLPLDQDFSSMEAEAIALDRAISACHYWIYYCPKVELISDCKGLVGLLDKHTSDVDNRSLQQILIRAGNYNWKTTYIRGKENRVVDTLSRLCRSICTYLYKYEKNIPILMTLSTRKALRAKQLEREDPLVLQLAELGSEDEEYVNMLNCLETEDYKFAPEELRRISNYSTDILIINLGTGTRITVRKGCEILVPTPLRERMHLTQNSNKTMMKQTQGKIFWP